MSAPHKVTKSVRISVVEAADLVPLAIMFRRFCKDRFQELDDAISEPRRHELNGQAHAEFIGRLSDGHLDVVLVNVETSERALVPREVWSTAFFPERPLLNESQIGGVEGEFFKHHRGWVAKVSQAQFDAALAQNSSGDGEKPGPKSFDTDALECAKELWPEGKPRRNRTKNAHKLCEKMKAAGKDAPALSTAEKILRRLPCWSTAGRIRTHSNSS